jgi:hypothetical protein
MEKRYGGFKRKREREATKRNKEPTENYCFDSRRRDTTTLLFEYTGLADEANHWIRGGDITKTC